MFSKSSFLQFLFFKFILFFSSFHFFSSFSFSFSLFLFFCFCFCFFFVFEARVAKGGVKWWTLFAVSRLRIFNFSVYFFEARVPKGGVKWIRFLRLFEVVRLRNLISLFVLMLKHFFEIKISQKRIIFKKKWNKQKINVDQSSYLTYSRYRNYYFIDLKYTQIKFTN